MEHKKDNFIKTYEALITSFAMDIKRISDYESLFGPHIPGVGNNYWNNNIKKPKIAFIGKDVGSGKVIGKTLDDLKSFILFSSELLDELDILNWNINYGQYAKSIIYLLSEIYNIEETELLEGKRNDILTSFVWAQRSSILNFSSSKKSKTDLSNDTWNQLNSACKSLDSLQLLIDTTSPDIMIISCQNIDGYFDVNGYKEIKNQYHLRLLRNEIQNKFIIHTCHPTHWKSDYDHDPFYSRLNEIVALLKNEIQVNNFFA